MNAYSQGFADCRSMVFLACEEIFHQYKDKVEVQDALALLGEKVINLEEREASECR